MRFRLSRNSSVWPCLLVEVAGSYPRKFWSSDNQPESPIPRHSTACRIISGRWREGHSIFFPSSRVAETNRRPLGHGSPGTLISFEEADVCLQFVDILEGNVVDERDEESLDFLVVFFQQQAFGND